MYGFGLHIMVFHFLWLIKFHICLGTSTASENFTIERSFHNMTITSVAGFPSVCLLFFTSKKICFGYSISSITSTPSERYAIVKFFFLKRISIFASLIAYCHIYLKTETRNIHSWSWLENCCSWEILQHSIFLLVFFFRYGDLSIIGLKLNSIYL